MAADGQILLCLEMRFLAPLPKAQRNLPCFVKDFSTLRMEKSSTLRQRHGDYYFKNCT